MSSPSARSCTHLPATATRSGPGPSIDSSQRCVDASTHRAVAVPLAPGGVLFFSGLIHHGTPPNYSSARRHAVQFHYAAADCRHMTMEEHAALFNEGGLYAGCRGWALTDADVQHAKYPTP